MVLHSVMVKSFAKTSLYNVDTVRCAPKESLRGEIYTYHHNSFLYYNDFDACLYIYKDFARYREAVCIYVYTRMDHEGF